MGWKFSRVRQHFNFFELYISIAVSFETIRYELLVVGVQVSSGPSNPSPSNLTYIHPDHPVQWEGTTPTRITRQSWLGTPENFLYSLPGIGGNTRFARTDTALAVVGRFHHLDRCNTDAHGNRIILRRSTVVGCLEGCSAVAVPARRRRRRLRSGGDQVRVRSRCVDVTFEFDPEK